MIEKSFKAKLAYNVAKNYGENHNIYLQKEFYSNRKNKRQSILNELQKNISDARENTPVSHYIKKKVTFHHGY